MASMSMHTYWLQSHPRVPWTRCIPPQRSTTTAANHNQISHASTGSDYLKWWLKSNSMIHWPCNCDGSLGRSDSNTTTSKWRSRSQDDWDSSLCSLPEFRLAMYKQLTQADWPPIRNSWVLTGNHICITPSQLDNEWPWETCLRQHTSSHRHHHQQLR